MAPADRSVSGRVEGHLDFGAAWVFSAKTYFLNRCCLELLAHPSGRSGDHLDVSEDDATPVRSRCRTAPGLGDTLHKVAGSDQQVGSTALFLINCFDLRVATVVSGPMSLEAPKGRSLRLTNVGLGARSVGGVPTPASQHAARARVHPQRQYPKPAEKIPTTTMVTRIQKCRV